jgi:hypothetical protein|nr:hypothetical protein [uncultured Desulfobacter sp.]
MASEDILNLHQESDDADIVLKLMELMKAAKPLPDRDACPLDDTQSKLLHLVKTHGRQADAPNQDKKEIRHNEWIYPH